MGKARRRPSHFVTAQHAVLATSGVVTIALGILASAEGVAHSISLLGWQGFLTLIAVAILTVVWPRAAKRIPRDGSLKWTLLVATALVFAAAGLLLGSSIYQAMRPEPSRAAIAAANLDFTGEHLDGQSFADRNLRHTDFAHATLSAVDFDSADLSESDFQGVVVKSSNFSGARMCAVDLRGADLRSAQNLSAVRDWSFAVYDSKTRWPDGFPVENTPGLVPWTPGALIYTCQPGTSRVMDLDQ